MKNKIIISIAGIALMLTSKVYASTIDSVVVSDFENSIFKISGTVENEEKGVSVVILKKGQAFTEGMLYGNDASIQYGIIENGNYEASFRFAAEEGIYEVYASNCDKKYEFENFSKDSILEFVEALGNNKISEDEILEGLERRAECMGINLAFINTDAKKDYLTKKVVENLSEIRNDKIEGVKNIVLTAEADLEFLDGLKGAHTASEVNSLLEKYSDSVKINLNIYNNLTDEKKIKVCLEFVESKYSDIEQFYDDFVKVVERVSSSKGNSQGTGNSGNTSSKGNTNPSDIVSSTNKIQFPVPETTAPTVLSLEDFKDIEGVEWAWDSILFVLQRNIMNGYGNGEFKPNEQLKREQAAKIITTAFGLYNGNLIPYFYDVDLDNWAAPYIASAQENELMLGIDENNFGYGRPVSRQDLCVIIYRAAQKRGIEFKNQKTDFADFEEISDYAKEAVAYLAGSGIINGMGEGRFNPAKITTRAQAAKVISEVIGMEDK